MQRYKGFGAYSTLGLDFVLSVVLCLGAGYWLDRKVGTRGWFTLGGFALGVATGFNFIYKAAKRLQRETEEEDRRLAEKRGTDDKDGDDTGR